MKNRIFGYLPLLMATFLGFFSVGCNESKEEPATPENAAVDPAVENVFEATLADLPQGQYEVLLAQPQLPGAPPATRFSIVAPPGEFARPEMDAASLRAAAERTRGKFYTIADAQRLLAELPAGRRVPVENLPPVSIWNRWWMLAGFVAALTAEWILRKRKGML